MKLHQPCHFPSSVLSAREQAKRQESFHVSFKSFLSHVLSIWTSFCSSVWSTSAVLCPTLSFVFHSGHGCVDVCRWSAGDWSTLVVGSLFSHLSLLFPLNWFILLLSLKKKNRNYILNLSSVKCWRTSCACLNTGETGWQWSYWNVSRGYRKKKFEFLCFFKLSLFFFFFFSSSVFVSFSFVSFSPGLFYLLYFLAGSSFFSQMSRRSLAPPLFDRTDPASKTAGHIFLLFTRIFFFQLELKLKCKIRTLDLWFYQSCIILWPVGVTSGRVSCFTVHFAPK